MTLGEMSKRMTERELRLWSHYAAKKGLPSRRLELGNALNALSVARSTGDGESQLTDFLFDGKEQQPKLTAEDGASALATMADGVGVRKLGQGRKKKGTG